MSDYGDHQANGNGDSHDQATNLNQVEPQEETLELLPAGCTREERDERIAASGWTHADDIQHATDDNRWFGGAEVYEWDDDYGEVAPRNPDLEKDLFENPEDRRPDGGVPLLSLGDAEITKGEKIAPFNKFEDAGLHPTMMENVALCGYKYPTPIQRFAIPAVLHGKDVVGIAQTGSGKTAAYLVPILSRLMGKAKLMAAPRPKPGDDMAARVTAEPLVLIICPTRELACQIFDECRRLCYRSMLRPCVIYGGAPVREQKMALEKGCDILVATPGRFQDFLKDPRLLLFGRLKYTVIDEADEMLSDGWEDTIEALFTHPGMNNDGDHTYLMFSATFPKEARRMARTYMAEDYVQINVGRIGSTHTNIDQQIVYTDLSKKNQALWDLLVSGPCMRTMVFVNSKAVCDRVDDYLFNNCGLPVTSIHSDRTQREREDAMRAFRTGKCPIIVATGVSARGLDAFVEHVINYDLPSVQYGGITEYIHRIGRTARIGMTGKATSFYNEDRDEQLAPDLVKILVESKQEVPDFLEHLKPDDINNIDFDDASESDDPIDEVADALGGVTVTEQPEEILDYGSGETFTPEVADDAVDKMDNW